MKNDEFLAKPKNLLESADKLKKLISSVEGKRQVEIDEALGEVFFHFHDMKELEGNDRRLAFMDSIFKIDLSQSQSNNIDQNNTENSYSERNKVIEEFSKFDDDLKEATLSILGSIVMIAEIRKLDNLMNLKRWLNVLLKERGKESGVNDKGSCVIY